MFAYMGDIQRPRPPEKGPRVKISGCNFQSLIFQVKLIEKKIRPLTLIH